jgi:hypothetical protein
MQNFSHIPLAFWGLTTPVWIALWSVLALLTFGLIVLVRTRWSTNRTWRMCGVLSDRCVLNDRTNRHGATDCW